MTEFFFDLHGGMFYLEHAQDGWHLSGGPAMTDDKLVETLQEVVDVSEDEKIRILKFMDAMDLDFTRTAKLCLL